MKVITTVGTSMFTNFFDGKGHGSLKTDFEALKNKPYAFRFDYKTKAERLRTGVQAWVKDKPEASAEVASLLKIQDKVAKEIEVTLLASDTVLSCLAADILKDVLAAKPGIETKFDKDDVITGLQITDHARFEKEGMPNLLSRIERWLDGYPENKAINMTGGYKATLPYLTIMAQINNLPLYYIFDGENAELICIPQAPLSINWGLFAKYHDVLTDLKDGIEDWQNYKRRRAIDDDFQSCIYVDADGSALLNAIGDMFWKKFEKSFLVQVRDGCGYRTEKAGDKAQLKRLLEELYRKINARFKNEWEGIRDTAELCKKIQSLSENDDLRHASVGKPDIFIFKSTDQGQHRLLYRPELDNGLLQIKLFEYDLTPHRKSHYYIEKFKKKISAYTVNKEEYTTITIKKPEAI